MPTWRRSILAACAALSTTGASLVGGAATLEWLRRKASEEEPEA
jgi:hypothetical protein